MKMTKAQWEKGQKGVDELLRGMMARHIDQLISRDADDLTVPELRLLVRLLQKFKESESWAFSCKRVADAGWANERRGTDE